jgi:alpha-N-dichloroacetyl-p-aminophenylserinol N-oxygenase
MNKITTYNDQGGVDGPGQPGAGGPSLPAHDPQDPLENAVISRLAGNWYQRAAVKRDEPNLDDLFDADRPDFPERLVPFHDHAAYLRSDNETKAKVLSWALIAYNKNIMDVEHHVVNPGFRLIAEDVFDTGLNQSQAVAVVQAMVDEEYHTLMHLNASAVTRRQRGWPMPQSALPLSYRARQCRLRVDEAGERWARDLTSLAFTTAAEVSISAHLDLVAKDSTVQPVHQVTATLHNRDEYCHSSISCEIAKAVSVRLPEEKRRFFATALSDALEAFSASDFSAWQRIVDLVGIEGGAQMMDDIEHEPGRKRLPQDFSGLYRLCAEMEILDHMPFDWSTVFTG